MYGKHNVDCCQMVPGCPCNHCARDNAWDRRGDRCCGMRECDTGAPCDSFEPEFPKVIGRKPDTFGYSAAMREQAQIESSCK